jgi:hypothetical protein
MTQEVPPTPAPGLAVTPAQERALAGLVETGTINAHQATAVRRALFTAAGPRAATNPASVLIEIVGYVGGGLILGGAVLLIGLNISQLGEDTAALILAGYAAILLLAGVLIGGGPFRAAALRDGTSPVRRRLVSVLLAIAAAPAAFAAALASGDHGQPALTAGLVGLAVAGAGYLLLSSIPGLLAIAATSITATAGALNLPDRLPHLAGTFAFVGLGLVFGLGAAVGLLSPRRIGLALGAAIAIVGAHLALSTEDGRVWTYGLTFLIGLICFVGYWVDRGTVLLVFGVLATTIAIPEAVTDWTDDALSGPAILLISGTVLVAVSGLGLWLRAIRKEPSGATT